MIRLVLARLTPGLMAMEGRHHGAVAEFWWIRESVLQSMFTFQTVKEPGLIVLGTMSPSVTDQRTEGL